MINLEKLEELPPSPLFKASDVVEAARSMVGVKYIHQGRDPQLGLDCAGLVFAAHKDAGWVALSPRTTLRTDYRKNAEKGAVIDVLNYEGEELASVTAFDKPHWLDIIRPGQIVALADTSGDRTVRHVAIVDSIQRIDVTRFGSTGSEYVTVPYIIHADNRRKKVVCEALSASWMEKVHGIYRFHGMVDDGDK